MIFFIFSFLATTISSIIIFISYKLYTSLIGYILMSVLIPIIFVITLALDYLIWYLVTFLLPNPKGNDYLENQSKFARFWLEQAMPAFLFTFRIKTHYEGLEKIPSDKKFLLVGNHRSSFDQMIDELKIRKYKIRWICKDGLFKVPGLRNNIYGAGFMKIERDNLRQSLKIISFASSLIKNNISNVGVYPEGTRNKTEEDVIEFKPGTMKIALKAECPIVIMATYNTSLVMKNWPLKRTHIYVKVCDVLNYEDYKDLDTVSLAKKVQSIVASNFSEMKRQYNK